MSDARDEAGRLERARGDRLRKGGARDLSAIMRAQIPDLRRMKKNLSGVAAAWNQIVPEPLASSVRLDGVAAGVLNVRVTDSAARFELDRFLRGGGEAALLKLMPMSIRRVRIGVEEGGPAEETGRNNKNR